jgi:hypothetical protein
MCGTVDDEVLSCNIVLATYGLHFEKVGGIHLALGTTRRGGTCTCEFILISGPYVERKLPEQAMTT